MKKRKLQPGDRVVITGNHPWRTNVGTLLAYERYGLGWFGWRVRLDNGSECYANAENLKKTAHRPEMVDAL